MFEKKILVVAAHPDDEVLGCGGTLSRFKNKEIQIMFLSDGVSSRGKHLTREINDRKKSALNFSKTISQLKPLFFDYPDNSFDNIMLLSIVKKIEKIIQKFKPDTILTHSSSDLNVDHRITNNAVITAARPIDRYNYVKTILFFEILSSTECHFSNDLPKFNPKVFIDISKNIKKKISGMNLYKNELRKWPHPRSKIGVETLAKFRGLSSNNKYAEAFEVGRLFIK
jgi:N-acetylglucosamine malate deacetylase 1